MARIVYIGIEDTVGRICEDESRVAPSGFQHVLQALGVLVLGNRVRWCLQ